MMTLVVFIRNRREIPASELDVLPYDALCQCNCVVERLSCGVCAMPCFWPPGTQNDNNNNKTF